jgi:Ca2+-transporting ATPase
MSFISATETFVEHRRQQVSLKKSKDVFTHKFLYDADDLQEMMSHFQEEDFALARLAEMGGVPGLAYALRTDETKGLEADETKGDDTEAAMAHRQEMFGKNEITRLPPTPIYELMLNELEDPMLRILVVAGLVSMIIGAVQDAKHHGWVDGLAVLFAVVVVVFVGAGNNYQKELQFRSMEEESEKNECIVIRAGEEESIPFTELVVGDLVVLRAGFAVPADGIFVLGTEAMKTDEAGLTGETRHITKNRHHPIFMKGTQVVKGEGLMIAVSVGDRTEWGQLMQEMQKEREETPLQKKLEKLGAQIGWGGAAVAVCLFLILVIKWAIGKRKDAANTIVDAFIVAITIVVVAVPEGLPLAVTISLAYSMKKMIVDKNFVRHHQACETMGNATTICSDKTGTLTQNLMSVTKVFIQDQRYFDALPTKIALGAEVSDLIHKSLVVNCKAFYPKKAESKDDDKKTFSGERKARLVGGNETECAMMQWGLDLSGDLDYMQLRLNNPVKKAFPFDSAVKRSSVFLRVNETQFVVYTKGAAEWILKLCKDYVADGDCNAQPLDEEAQGRIADSMEAMTRTGLRCLGVSYKIIEEADVPFGPDGTINNDDVEFFFEDMTWICVAGIQDRVRPEVPKAVLMCQQAGIIVRMVTGDHLETAKHIARECNILTRTDHVCMTGADFRNLDAAQKQEMLPKLRVLARAKPSDKRELVNWYKHVNGDVVAVTGDGANDALALTDADVGLAMGIQGTDVAKEASDIIITDDNFASIVKTVMWGRSVYDNIRKFVQFQLTVNVVALSISLIAAFFSQFQNPLTPVQLLWVNLIMDTMAALALATEPPTMELLNRSPYVKDCHLISKVLWRFVFGHSAYQLTVLLVTMFAADNFLNIDKSAKTENHQSKTHLTLIFNVFVVMQIFNEVNARRVQNERDVFRGIFDNYFFVGVMVITVILQALIVEVGGRVTSTYGLNAKEWGYTIAVGFGVWIWGQVVTSIPVDLSDGVNVVDKDALFKPNLPELEHKD